MKLETIRSRFEKASERADKKAATIERKRKTIANKQKKAATIADERERQWILEEIEELEEDITRLQKEVEEAKEAAAQWAKELALAEDKANSRNCQPILDFLERWKANVAEYYIHLGLNYREEGLALFAARQTYEQEHGPISMANDHDVWQEWYEKGKRLEKKYNVISRYQLHYCSTFDKKLLEKDLVHEAEARYDQLIERVTAVTGEITDATALRIGEKGDLEGLVKGKRGVAEVFTIGAGGYNIQCFHYRTLVKAR